MSLEKHLSIASAVTAESVSQYRRTRFNPLRNISPQMLTRVLDSFECGHMREFHLLAEVVADRDDTIKCVKSKREKSVACRPWSVLTRGAGEEALRHRNVLNDFWNRVRAVNAFDGNEHGGVGRLIKQMMSSASYRYAAHHLVWGNRGGKLTCTFEFVPLCFMENTTGSLRFMKSENLSVGELLAKDEWMITTGDGLMFPGLVGYTAKRFSLQDWLAFSEKFSMPGILGATAAAKGSPEGLAMKAAVESFSQDWSAVMYGVADPSKPPIHLIQPNGNPSVMPMPALVERIDRGLTSLWLGADLSTMSSTSGTGTGASVQANESKLLAIDDCAVISEALQEVEKIVIEWHFGKDTEPLAYFKLMPPAEPDKRDQLEIITGLVSAGARIGQQDAAGRLGFRLAGKDARAFGDRKQPNK